MTSHVFYGNNGHMEFYSVLSFQIFKANYSNTGAFNSDSCTKDTPFF